MAYKVVWLRGDYPVREVTANKNGCALVIHQHFNSGTRTANYCLVEIARPVLAVERNFAALLAQKQAKLIGIPVFGATGVKVLEDGDRGEFIIDQNAVSILNEPLFVSNPAGAAWIKNSTNRQKLAMVINECIRAYFPDGSTIGLSVGHKYKTSSPGDRGASVYGDGTEADMAEDVLNRLAPMLTAVTEPSLPPAPPAGYANVYRLYNTAKGNHIYTENENELKSLLAQKVWKLDGVAWLSPDTDTGLVFRYLKPDGSHFYTIDKREAIGVYEGAPLRTSNTTYNSFPVYRLYNIAKGFHLYTASEYEKASLVNAGTHQYDGVAWYVGK